MRAFAAAALCAAMLVIPASAAESYTAVGTMGPNYEVVGLNIFEVRALRIDNPVILRGGSTFSLLQSGLGRIARFCGLDELLASAVWETGPRGGDGEWRKGTRLLVAGRNCALYNFPENHDLALDIYTGQ